MTTVWTNDAIRTTHNVRTQSAERTVTCFEVLDFDSLTHVRVNDNFVNIVGIIYKKVTIAHLQERQYELQKTDPDVANIKDTDVDVMPLWYLDTTPAIDEFSYSGTRTVEYKLCLLVGETKYTIDLGTIVITVNGSHNIAGTDKELKEDAASVTATGPAFAVTGDRLYGISVNCGLEALTYSYDLEEYSGGFTFDTDSPINIEDYNDYWTKKSRKVGAMNYYNIHDSKEFLYGTAGTSGLPDKVMAVGYRKE